MKGGGGMFELRTIQQAIMCSGSKTGRECKIATVIKDAMDQVHKFPYMGKFLHLIQLTYDVEHCFEENKSG